MLAHRVPSRCEANMPKLSRDFITKEICQKVKGDFPPNGLKVGLYNLNKMQIQKEIQKQSQSQWSQSAMVSRCRST